MHSLNMNTVPIHGKLKDKIITGTVTSDVIYVLAKECTTSDPLAHCKAIQKTNAIVCTGLASRHNNRNFFLLCFWPRH